MKILSKAVVIGLLIATSQAHRVIIDAPKARRARILDSIRGNHSHPRRHPQTR